MKSFFKANYPRFLTGLAFLVIIVSRFICLDKIPEGFEGDEIRWMMSSAAVLEGKVPSDFGIYVGFDRDWKQYPVVFLLGAFFYKASSLVQGHVRLLEFRYFLAISNILSLGFFYLLLKEFFSWKISLTFLITYALSDYGMITARVFLGNSFVFIFFIPALYFLIKTIKTTKPIFSLLSGVFISITLGTFNIAYQYLFLFFFVLIYFLWTKISQGKTQKLLGRECFLIAFAFAFFPALFFGKWMGNISGNMISRSYAYGPTISLTKNISENGKIFSENFGALSKNFFNLKENVNHDFFFYSKQSLVPSLISFLALIGLILGIFNWRKYFPLVIIFLGGVVWHASLRLVSPRMFVPLIPLFYLLAAITTEKAISFLKKSRLLSGGFVSLMVLAFAAITFAELKNFIKVSAFNPAYHSYLREVDEIYHFQASSLAGESCFFWILDSNNQAYKDLWFWTWESIDKFYFHSSKKKSPFVPLFPEEIRLASKGVLGTGKSCFLILEKRTSGIRQENLANNYFKINPRACGQDIVYNQQLVHFKICRLNTKDSKK